MAQTRVIVDKALLIEQITTLNAKEVKEYEKNLAKWQKAKDAELKALSTVAQKVAKAIAKGAIRSLSTSSGYCWEEGQRVDYGTDLRIELEGVFPAEFGNFANRNDRQPNDPRLAGHGAYYEREQMLKTLAMSSKNEISLPVSWSGQYL